MAQSILGLIVQNYQYFTIKKFSVNVMKYNNYGFWVRQKTKSQTFPIFSSLKTNNVLISQNIPIAEPITSNDYFLVYKNVFSLV